MSQSFVALYCLSFKESIDRLNRYWDERGQQEVVPAIDDEKCHQITD